MGRRDIVSPMELILYSDAHLPLTEAIETDPEMMAELGGAVAREDIPAIHKRRLETVEAGDLWLVILPEPDGPPAGTVGIWPRDWDGKQIHEAGWMVLPEFQGRGIATQALGMLIERACGEPAIESLHAFPGTTNAPSNALCHRFGFQLIGEHQGEYRGRAFRVNHWRVDL
jgi:RimJ/RimL family protein N-acetyltransferase